MGLSETLKINHCQSTMAMSLTISTTMKAENDQEYYWEGYRRRLGGRVLGPNTWGPPYQQTLLFISVGSISSNSRSLGVGSALQKWPIRVPNSEGLL